MTSTLLGGLLGGLNIPTRSIFVSYHHSVDGSYYDVLSNTFSNIYGIARDNSVDRDIESNNPEYVMRQIRENYITGTSCTVVLCGAFTPQRKFVDWEIKATLDRQHGLIGIELPSISQISNDTVSVPLRLNQNINSGYALWIPWNTTILYPTMFHATIESANAKSSLLIQNSTPLKSRNG